MPARIPIATSAEGCASGDCLPEATDTPEAAAEEAEVASTQALPAAERWKAAVEAVRLANPRIGKSLSYGRMISIAGGDVRLAFPTDAGFHRATVFGHARAELEKHISKRLGETLKIVEEKSDAAWQQAGRSVAEQEAAEKATREKAIEAKVRQNPAVLSVLKVLGGTLEHVQVLEPASRTEEAVPATPDEDA
ncbi:MAG: DNA polymerase III subunit gamma/tau [Archangiaceae bacterium]|nr:DNA polymerase III subunit gamma/tau [Archangiaceae bacterium]